MLKRLACLMLALLLPCYAAAEDALRIVPYEPTQTETDYAALLGLDVPTQLYRYDSAAALRMNVYALQNGTWALVDTHDLPLPGATGRIALQGDLTESLRIALQSGNVTELLIWQPLLTMALPDMSTSTATLCTEAVAAPSVEIPLRIQCGDDTFPLTIDHFAAPADLPYPACAITLLAESP